MLFSPSRTIGLIQSTWERFAAVTLDQVRQTAKDMLDPERLVWVVIGDLSKIEESVRSLDYGEVEIWDAVGERIR